MLLSHINSPTNLDAVHAFLSGLGLSSSDITTVVASDPLFLCSKVNVTLALCIAKLHDIGLCDSKIIRLILTNPYAISSCDITSSLQFWIPLFGSFDELLHTVSNGGLGGGSILRHHINNVVKPNVALFLRCGINLRDLAKTGCGGVWVIACSLEKLRVLVKHVEELGVPRGSVLFKYALTTVSWVSQEKLVARMELLKKALGCSKDLMHIAVIKHPSILRASEDNVRTTVEFLINDIGLELEYIMRRPALLGYSLKGRLVPRYLVQKTLQDKGLLNADYCSLAVAREDHFVSRYIHFYKDSVPRLIDLYAVAHEGKYP